MTGPREQSNTMAKAWRAEPEGRRRRALGGGLPRRGLCHNGFDPRSDANRRQIGIP